MALYKCPHCKTEMNKVRDPDITTDKCPSCGGVFLEKGELNVLATGMAGDIEYSSIDDSKIRSDKFPIRICPKCSDEKMEKINLLALSDLIFDFCPNCESFFLDKGEIQLMNEYLRDHVPEGKTQEYRGYRNNYLVRIERRSDERLISLRPTAYGATPMGVMNFFIYISVYFPKPLRADLRVFQEKWHAQLAKAMGLLKVQDIPTEDEEFDKKFRVQGEDENAVVYSLPHHFRKALLKFISTKPKIVSHIGSIQISRNMILYKEGPYTHHSKKVTDLVTKAEPIVQELLRLATLLAPA